ncbi:hypothetical protein STEG23_000279, partial [Scotinomys teguina]
KSMSMNLVLMDTEQRLFEGFRLTELSHGKLSVVLTLKKLCVYQSSFSIYLENVNEF